MGTSFSIANKECKLNTFRVELTLWEPAVRTETIAQHMCWRIVTFDLLVFDPILLTCTNTINITDYENEASVLEFEIMCFRDRGATLRWGGGGGGGGHH